MGLIPCDEAAHIHTNSLLNLEVWGSAKGRSQTLVVNLSASVSRPEVFSQAVFGIVCLLSSGDPRRSSVLR